MSIARHKFVPLLLLTFTFAGCQDPLISPDSDPTDLPRPQFAQGDGGVWTVNTLADPGDGTCDDTECTLREAIGAAASGEQIVFAAGLSGDITVLGHLSVIGKDLSINGDGRISINGGKVNRVFEVDGLSDPYTLSLTGLIIEDGDAGTENGGAIWTHGAGGLELHNVTVRGSRAADGGGVYVSNHLMMEASTIEGNIADERGGGLYLANGTASITRSTISGNHSQGSTGGGGIYNGATLHLRSSTIVGNDAHDGSGGGLLNVTDAYLANSIVAGNIAAPAGSENCAEAFMGGDLASLGYTMSEQGRVCGVQAAGDIRLVVGQLLTEVLEKELKDNGGPTWTHALIVRGRAVDAGYCPGESVDQRGFARPVDNQLIANAQDACDIGAYELQGPFVARTDLILSQTSDKTSVKQGDLLTYTVRVRNLGPETAPNAVLINELSSGVTFVSATSAKGTRTTPPLGETGVVTWYIGDLLDQANETTEIRVTVRVKGKTTVTNKASVSSDAVDPNTANNTASLTVSVVAGSTKPPTKGK